MKPTRALGVLKALVHKGPRVHRTAGAAVPQPWPVTRRHDITVGPFTIAIAPQKRQGYWQAQVIASDNGRLAVTWGGPPPMPSDETLRERLDREAPKLVWVIALPPKASAPIVLEDEPIRRAPRAPRGTTR